MRGGAAYKNLLLVFLLLHWLVFQQTERQFTFSKSDKVSCIIKILIIRVTNASCYTIATCTLARSMDSLPKIL